MTDEMPQTDATDATPNGKQYRVLREGVEQRGPAGERVKCLVGTFIEMSDAAAEHLCSEGWAEEVIPEPKRRRKVASEPAEPVSEPTAEPVSEPTTEVTGD